MQPVVGQHLHGLVGGSDNVWTEAKENNTHFNTLTMSEALKSKAVHVIRDSPFVVLAGQRSIHQFANGSWVADVIDDHSQRLLCSALPVNLVRHIGEVQLQILTEHSRYLTLSQSWGRNVK